MRVLVQPAKKRARQSQSIRVTQRSGGASRTTRQQHRQPSTPLRSSTRLSSLSPQGSAAAATAAATAAAAAAAGGSSSRSRRAVTTAVHEELSEEFSEEPSEEPSEKPSEEPDPPVSDTIASMLEHQRETLQRHGALKFVLQLCTEEWTPLHAAGVDNSNIGSSNRSDLMITVGLSVLEDLRNLDADEVCVMHN
jgi:hypothetical protein